MSSKLEYSLGLSTTNFLGGIVGANQALELFGKTAGAVGDVFKNVFREIERGGALADLSKRAGETVQTMFQLGHAFEVTGVAGATVAPMLQKIRQSLSGVGEFGENTADAFAAIGLNIRELQGLAGGELLQKIFTGLSKLDRDAAAGVAQKLFGRGMAGDALQMTRDLQDFAAAYAEAARQGALFGRNADLFDQIGKSIKAIKLDVRGIFAGMAENIAPPINAALSALATKDFPNLAKIAELGLTVAFENATQFLANALAKVFAALPELAKGSGHAGVGGIGVPLAGAFARFLAGQNADIAADPSRNPAMRANAAQAAFGWRVFAAATGEATSGEMAKAGKAFTKAVQDGLKAIGPKVADGANAAKLKELTDKFKPGGDGKPGAGGNNPLAGIAATNLLSGPGGSLGDANALQRMGLWNVNGSNGDMRTIRGGVVQMVQHLAEIRRAVTTQPRQMDLRNQ